MSKTRLVFVAMLPLALAMAAVFVAVGAAPTPEAAKMSVYAEPNGPTYFALSLRPTEVIPPAEKYNVVVLINTSASQKGESRTQATEALKSLLASLGPNDRVQLIAYDALIPAKLTSEFIAPKGPEADAALAKLADRAPLGSSDLDKALSSAIAAFGADASARALVLIGDGSSRANIITPERFGVLVGELASKKIPVTSYAVGQNIDEQVLGALAGQTGGIVVESKVAAAEAGKALATAADAAVLWPAQATFPAAIKEVFPKQAPPLRYDRDTVLIGTLSANGPIDLQMAVDTPAGKKTLSWKAAKAESNEQNGYLAKLVSIARPTGGVTIPIVSSAQLAEAAEASSSSSLDLANLAIQALATGDKANAQRLAAEALARDPKNDKAQSVVTALQKSGPGELNMKEPPLPEAPEESALQTQEAHLALVAKQTKATVEATINNARQRMSVEPEQSINELKVQLTAVKSATELQPAQREQLKNQLESAIRDGERRKTEVESRRQQERALLAAARERQETLSATERKQLKIQQLLMRYEALMQEGKYKAAEEQVAAEARRIDPKNTGPIAAELIARTEFYLTENLRLREDRQKKVCDTLFECEKAYVPFPGEPPIVYPDAEVWRQLTERRKEWAAMNLIKSGRNKTESRIIKTLDQATKIEIDNLPLNEVIKQIADIHTDPSDGWKLPIMLDEATLRDDGSLDKNVEKFTVSGISLRSALKHLLKQFDLTYIIKDEVLLVTTRAAAEEPKNLVTKVYPVADLVVPPTTMGGGMMGGMMGGGMGGMGGGMMGGMGGGMGGMGGGMGGMGGGMGGMGGGMGMGFMNLPPALQNLLRQPNPNNGFRAFSVTDDLSLSAHSDPAPKTSSAAPAAVAAAPAKAIRLDIAKDADPQAAWDTYFAKNTPARTDVRETVRQLGKANQHRQIVALVRAALRHNQDQPWMYEALALSLQLTGAPKEEIERAVMSAVEFARTSLDLLTIGAYLEQLELPQRALQVYRQVAQMDPLLPEAYVQGLRVAQQLDDLEGIQWATVGVLAQAWPREHQDVWERSCRVARATLENLKRLGKTEAAKKYEAALDAAVARDVAIVVTWTGEGDIDLTVQEPSGTLCSMRSPRTLSGGVMLGDLKAQVGKEDSGSKSAIYVCPKSFSGSFNATVRRVWGKVTAERVKVDVVQHFLTSNQKIESRWIPIKNDLALVKFDLTGGRRVESIQERQLAVATANQLVLRQQMGQVAQIAMNQPVLAQQLGSYDPSALARLYSGLAGAGLVGGEGGVNRFVVPSGAVGYQPVIQIIPQGTMLMTTAVISADRRYVRISPSPNFMAITKVDTFNYFTGSTGTSNSGQGGIGGNQGGGGFGGGGGGGGGFF